MTVTVSVAVRLHILLSCSLAFEIKQYRNEDILHEDLLTSNFKLMFFLNYIFECGSSPFLISLWILLLMFFVISLDSRMFFWYGHTFQNINDDIIKEILENKGSKSNEVLKRYEVLKSFVDTDFVIKPSDSCFYIYIYIIYLYIGQLLHHGISSHKANQSCRATMSYQLYIE